MDPSDVSGLPTFLVEAYAATMTRDELSAAIARAERIAAELRRDGEQVEYLGALFVPGDEVVFHVLAARDIGLVRSLCSRSAVTCERIVRDVSTPAPSEESRPGRRSSVPPSGRPSGLEPEPQPGG